MDFNPEFISRMISKVEWSALLQAAEQVRKIINPINNKFSINTKKVVTVMYVT